MGWLPVMRALLGYLIDQSGAAGRIEWSSDPSSLIPETFDMYNFWYSFQTNFRNTWLRVLGLTV
jgi:hypothetical protein